MTTARGSWIDERPLGRLGPVEVSRFETPTGVRLRLRRQDAHPAEAFLDPLELEGLTRVRYIPLPMLEGRAREAPPAPAPQDQNGDPAAEETTRLQNEFALVDVGVAPRGSAGAGLLIRDLNAGQSVLLTADELETLLRARHMDLAPLVDTSNLVAVPEPDIDQA